MGDAMPDDPLNDIRRRARRLSEQGRAGEALALVTKSLANAPQDPSLLCESGYALAHLGRWKEAAGAFGGAAEGDPNNADTRLFHAQAALNAGSARHAAASARAAIMPYYRGAAATLETRFKADESPVTAADRAAEQAIRAVLASKLPGHGIIGEEFGASDTAASHQWVLDPIDGTKAFAGGRPLFGTLIALLIDGRPVLGLIDQPATGDRWIGDVGQPTRLNGQPCRVRPCRRIADAWVATTAPDMFNGISGGQRAMDLHRQAAVSLWGGDCINYALLAAGRCDLVIEAGLKLHDFAALIPVIQGAGGVISDWRGRPLTPSSPGDVIAAATPELHAETVARLGRNRRDGSGLG